jgi:hypothetical protein
MSKDLSTIDSFHVAIAARMRLVINYMNLSKNAFAMKIGHRNMSKSLLANKAPSIKIIIAIHEHFPEISLEWLLSGRGSMLYYDQKSTVDTVTDTNPAYQSSSLNDLIRSLDELTKVVKNKLEV